MLVPAAPAAAEPGMVVGAAESTSKQPDFVAAVAKTQLAKLAGFGALRVTTHWLPGQTEPAEADLASLKNAVDAAQLNGVAIVLVVMHPGSRTTPLTPEAREQFASYAAALAKELPYVREFVVGNEPNLNRFWMPQFTKTGGNAAAFAYEKLLAQTYDALKEVDPELTVIGGALAPRGQDDVRAPRHTHSPTSFLISMGRAYRKSGREKPIMDALALHPYPKNSRKPPGIQHPLSTEITLGDYDKLRVLLAEAFGGTAQRGASLPIYYTEFGVQSKIPRRKRRVYKNHTAPAARDAVSEKLQARYYREALRIAYCQPTVRGFFFFHVVDERDLKRWQSGVFYADDTPKSSLGPVRRAVQAVANGTIARCAGGAPTR